MKFVLRAFRIEGSVVATGREGLAAKAVSDLMKLGPEGMLAEWIRDADIEAHDGRGDVWFTRDVTKAKHFDKYEDAFEYWRAQSKTRPLRPDGRPNRPLTAINMTIEAIPDYDA